MIVIAILIYNFAIIALTAYLVAVHDWNPWWFLAAIMVMLTVKGKDIKE